MAKRVSDYWTSGLTKAMKAQLAWLVGQLNANTSPFVGTVVATPTAPIFAEGAMNRINGDYDTVAQAQVENIVFDPLQDTAYDTQTGPDKFAINWDPVAGGLLVNFLQFSGTPEVSGRTANLIWDYTQYRVDLYAATDALYYHGSTSLNPDGTWTLTPSNSSDGTWIAFLMPASISAPSPGDYTQQVTSWLAHTNMGVGSKLRDYWARIYNRTDIEYLHEDYVPIIVQDFVHARFGSDVIMHSGDLTAHIIYNHPTFGPVDLYSTLQNDALYADMPRSLEIPMNDPQFIGAGPLTASNMPHLETRAWIYATALALIAYTVAGLWAAAKRVIKRMDAVRNAPGYLPTLMLENAEDGLTTRWSLASGTGSIANIYDSTQTPLGGNVIQFTGTSSAAAWNYVGSGFPDSADKVIHWRYVASVSHRFLVGVTTLYGQVTQVIFDSSAAYASYDSVAKTVTTPIPLIPSTWRTVTQDLNALIAGRVPGESLVSISSFKAELDAAGTMEIDDLSMGSLQPAGSLSFSYDVFNGQIDQAYLRTGANAWMAYAYGIYMERTADFTPALSLQAMLNYLFSLQSSDPDARNGLFYLGNGKYQNPGYQYIPGAIHSCSTEHNINCFFAFEKAARVLPTAAQSLFQKGLITWAQRNSLVATANQCAAAQNTVKNALITMLYTAPSAAARLNNHAYALGDQIQDGAGNQHKCLVAGTSGGSPPIFSTVLGQSTPDGGVTWELTGMAGDPGHFAQGIHSTAPHLLDVAESLDSNASWSGLFTHAIHRDDIAVECLKFAYLKFWVVGQQILYSNNSDSYNEAYQQLAKFPGFLFYTDSAGPDGYSGSPLSVSQEMGAGCISAYLRMQSNSALQAFFNAYYPNGIDDFIRQLTGGMKIVSSTTADDGILSYSLAAKSLPWEFDVRKHIAATAWFWITAFRNDILFWLPGEGDGDTIGQAVLKVPQGVEQSVDFLNGRSSLGALQVEAVDVGGLMTGLASGGKLEGRKVTLKVGYAGMNLSDFVTLSTQQIDHITLQDDATSFILNCIDLKRSLKSQIFLTGDDGESISSDHPRSILANPMDVILMVLQNELGIGQIPDADEADWQIYDPSLWAGGSNFTLIDPNPYVDIEQMLYYRNGIFAGWKFEFTLTGSAEAKQFLENEIFKPLGGYLISLANGMLSPRFFFPPYLLAGIPVLNERNIIGIPKVDRAPIINQVVFRLDAEDSAGSSFGSELNFFDVPSLQQFDLAGEQFTESKGMRSVWAGPSLAGIAARRIFKRYSGMDPVSGDPNGGAILLAVEAFLGTFTIEVGDYVLVTHRLLPDFALGTRGLYSHIFECTKRRPDYTAGKMTYEFLDTGWMASKALSKIAPNGTPAWGSASDSQKATYAFIAAEATLAMSDGSPPKTIW